MVEMIDTHAHLTWPTCEGRVEEIVRRAREAGVSRIIDLGTNLESSRRAREHARRYPGVFFAAGIHPNDAAEAGEGDLAAVERLARDPRCVAVGEIGLDFYRDHCPRAVQEAFLRAQLAIAKRIGKPVVLHDRQAGERLLEVLAEEEYDGLNAPGGVFHCFAGSAKTAGEVLRRGFYLSFTGNLTFRKSDRPRVALRVPLNRLLLETDSPFMAPVPRRGRENEPAFLPYIAAVHAETRNISLEAVAVATTENAVRLFRLDSTPPAAG